MNRSLYAQTIDYKVCFAKSCSGSRIFAIKVAKKKSNQPVRADLTKCSTDFKIRLQHDQNILPIENRFQLHYDIWILSKLTPGIMTNES